MKFVFVLALGRSGTHFLHRLLTLDRRAAVYHEPCEDDAALMHLRYCGFNAVADQWLEARFSWMRERAGDADVYVETNSYLRYEANWLRDNLDATVVHVVRDGRTYVPSAYIRDVYTSRDRQFPIVPRDDDPLVGNWGHMTRFERICWYWNHTNAMLADQISVTLRMEDMLAQYASVADKLLGPGGLDIDKADWEKAVQAPSNTSRRYQAREWGKALLRRRGRPNSGIGGWDQWDNEQRSAFERICGGTMRRLGYQGSGV